MDRRIIGICLICLMCACGGKQKKSVPLLPEPIQVDTLMAEEDTSFEEEQVEDLKLPARADESFADFLYNFAIDDKLQRSRIVFPLPCYTDNRKDSIDEEEWIYDPFFSQLESYSILFDRVEDMELEKDVTSNSVQIEWNYLSTDRIKRYYFERVQGKWILEAIDYAAIPKEKSAPEDFYNFYERFVNDSIFQLERIAHPLHFVTIDPDDEFQVLETTLEIGQWFAFQPALPREFLTNVNYGQRLSQKSHSRIIELKGFGNGFYNILHFQRRGGVWKLVKYEDLGD